MDKRGKFIVFEGGEGSGKSTMARRAVAWLEGRGTPAVLTREPGGSPFAEEIRKAILSDAAGGADPEILFHLFWLARREHLRQTVLPALSAGRVVICDRFDASTYAYQVVAQQHPQLRELFWVFRKRYVGADTPHLYIHFDIHPDIGLARAKSRAEKATHFDGRELEFHHRVRQGFHEFLKSPEEIPAVHIDAGAPMEEVEKAMQGILLLHIV